LVANRDEKVLGAFSQTSLRCPMFSYYEKLHQSRVADHKQQLEEDAKKHAKVDTRLAVLWFWDAKNPEQKGIERSIATVTEFEEDIAMYQRVLEQKKTPWTSVAWNFQTEIVATTKADLPKEYQGWEVRDKYETNPFNSALKHVPQSLPSVVALDGMPVVVTKNEEWQEREWVKDDLGGFAQTLFWNRPDKSAPIAVDTACHYGLIYWLNDYKGHDKLLWALADWVKNDISPARVSLFKHSVYEKGIFIGGFFHENVGLMCRYLSYRLGESVSKYQIAKWFPTRDVSVFLAAAKTSENIWEKLHAWSAAAIIYCLGGKRGKARALFKRINKRSKDMDLGRFGWLAKNFEEYVKVNGTCVLFGLSYE